MLHYVIKKQRKENTNVCLIYVYIFTNMFLTKQDRKTSVTILISVTGHMALAGGIDNFY